MSIGHSSGGGDEGSSSHNQLRGTEGPDPRRGGQVTPSTPTQPGREGNLLRGSGDRHRPVASVRDQPTHSQPQAPITNPSNVTPLHYRWILKTTEPHTALLSTKATIRKGPLLNRVGTVVSRSREMDGRPVPVGFQSVKDCHTTTGLVEETEPEKKTTTGGWIWE